MIAAFYMLWYALEGRRAERLLALEGVTMIMYYVRNIKYNTNRNVVVTTRRLRGCQQPSPTHDQTDKRSNSSIVSVSGFPNRRVLVVIQF